jgi:hypothetical protein
MSARVMSPVVLHVTRPYSSEEEYLAAEAWTIEPRSVTLIGQRELENDTPVVFDVGLASGEKVLRAEGRVVGFTAETADEPSYLKVRFRRYGSQTKQFIERALAARDEQLARAALRASSLPPRGDDAPTRPSLPPIAAPAAVSQPEELPQPPEFSRLVLSPPLVAEPDARMAELRARSFVEPSGIRRRPISQVAPPPNREELLERLRLRARSEASWDAKSRSGTN